MNNTNQYLDFYGLHYYNEKLKKYVDGKTIKTDNVTIDRNISGELEVTERFIQGLKDYISENYASNTKVSQIISRLNTLIGADEEGHKIDVTSIIDTFNEIKDFLANVEDTTLTELFNQVNTRISNTLQLIGIDDIQEFDSTKNYSINDIVIYSNKLYKFIETHSAGAWIGTDVLETDLIKEIDRRLTETYNLVESINNTLAVVNLSATPSMIFVGDSLSIQLVATTDTEATEIRIRDNDTVIAEGSGTRLTGYKNIEMTQPSINSFYASFIINGITKTVSATVTAVNKIYYGSGTVYTDAAIVPPAKLTPEGIYNVNVIEDGQYVFFNIPTSMILNRATMNGIEFPLDEPTTVTIDGIEYKSYKSSNTVDAGTYEIIIS